MRAWAWVVRAILRWDMVRPPGDPPPMDPLGLSINWSMALDPSGSIWIHLAYFGSPTWLCPSDVLLMGCYELLTVSLLFTNCRYKMIWTRYKPYKYEQYGYIYIYTWWVFILNDVSYILQASMSPMMSRSAKARRFASATRLGWLSVGRDFPTGIWDTGVWPMPYHAYVITWYYMQLLYIYINCVQETATEHCVAFIWTLDRQSIINQSMLHIWQNRAIAWACFGRKADFCSFSGNTLGPISTTRTTLGLHPRSAQSTVILALCLWDAGRFADGELIITVWTDWRHVKTCQDM